MSFLSEKWKAFWGMTAGAFNVIIDNRSDSLKYLTNENYQDDLLWDNEKAKLAFEKAWDARKFEIELYWKRATYFWTFIAATFAGYFTLVNSSSQQVTVATFAGHFAIVSSLKEQVPLGAPRVEVYFVICIGFILSVAWLFTNKGSKAWQRHWEVHVDLLEDRIVGPLYKTVYSKKTYSVSKINEIVSFVFAAIWLLLGIKFLFENDLVHWNLSGINWWIFASTAISALAVVSMQFGYGRGRFSKRPVTMRRRDVTYEDKV